MPGQEVVSNSRMNLLPYNPALPACQGWRPAVVGLVAHSRQSTMNDPTGTTGQFFSPHYDGCHFLFMDGSARLLHRTTDQQVMWTLCTRSHGEVVPSGAF